MKKLFLSLAAIVGMFAVSCTTDATSDVQMVGGEEAVVTFSVQTTGLGSRAVDINDGKKATELTYAIYDEAWNHLQTYEAEFENGSLVKELSLRLVKNKTYNFVFWAQNPGVTCYKTDFETAGQKPSVSVNYDALVANNDNYDAFFGQELNLTVNGTVNKTVYLKRPFAQINFGTNDLEAADDLGFDLAEAEVSVTTMTYSKFFLNDGAVAGEQREVTFTKADAIDKTAADKNLSTESYGDYHWVSMNYILWPDFDAAADASEYLSLSKCEMTVSLTGQTDIVVEVPQAPARRNWRTNLVGSLLTEQGNIKVEILPTPEGEYNPDDANGKLIELIMKAGLGGEVTLTEDVTLTKPLNVTAEMVVNLNGNTINYTGDDVLFRVNGATLTVNGTVDGSTVVTEPTTPGTGGNGYIGLVKDGGTLNINGGIYDAKGTCTIAQVAKGTLNVYGGTFSVNLDEWTDANGEARYLLNCSDTPYKNGEAVINVYGGSFYKFNPANNAAEGAGTSFCAKGYKTAKVDDYYMIVAEETSVVSTSEQLVAAFENGGKVILADDVELKGVLTVKAGAEVYLDMNGKTMTVAKEADPAFYTYKGSTLVIDGNGTVELADPALSLVIPGGDVVIENGTFVRNVPVGTPANQVGALFVGMKVSPWGSQTVTINGGYFDGGYYNTDAADIEEILAGTKTFEETDDDIAKRGNSKDANKVRVAIKQNVQLLLNLSYNLFKIYGGTFVGANPAWGDEGCMLPTTPNYLRPWSYYQGALLDGQTFNENGIVLPEGYAITKGNLEDGRPTYTVSYSK